MNAMPVPVQTQLENVELFQIAENDLAEAAAFIASQSQKPRGLVEDHLRWLLLENPARDSKQPMGFALRSSGGMGGCILCLPQMFRCSERSILLMGSSSFYVDERHRGYGGRLFLQYSRLANRWPLFGTSANPDAAALWKAVGANPIPHSEGELFGVINWPPVAEEFARRRTSNRFAARLAATAVSKAVSLFCPMKLDRGSFNSLTPLDSAKQVCDLLQQDRPSKLTSSRDRNYIHWRYFSGHDETATLFAYLDSNREFLVAVNRRARGSRGQIETLNLLDVYPEASANETIRIAGALIARYADRVDALVLRNQNRENREAFLKAGFRWRAFDAPTGWVLDRAKHLPAGDWHIAPADGDGLI